MPYDKHGVDPYTRCRVIAMNAIEVEADTALLAELAEAADDGPSRAALRDAATKLTPVAREHAQWAEQALRRATVTQAKHPFARKAAQAAERVTGKLRSAFGSPGT
ncbi:hypothetical protein I6A84_36825 [Frankia sp. CNm7]|uniref:Uncharacterized protein n=1 Tax=Frankia nepalensis TaxID=1836974 RepID=A0A937RM32_9ACTN|nr:hypothetical protein [Frankia nepalensis]MBL7495741.1 hypothetical protein [Frankia nepalensis]MBL7509015.1 hypothetical protein [Frankia nepalensis]MBL7523474.1 hypothetical protein [Frankia nepalensis]MBL7629814.1 hypothetical protein [Frankia nepalensis]